MQPCRVGLRGWQVGGSACRERGVCCVRREILSPSQVGHHVPQGLAVSVSCSSPWLLSDLIVVTVEVIASKGWLLNLCLRPGFPLKPVLTCKHMQGKSIHVSCLCLPSASHTEGHSFLLKLLFRITVSPDGTNLFPVSRTGAVLSPVPSPLSSPHSAAPGPRYLVI